jgi:hypothetical protein
VWAAPPPQERRKILQEIMRDAPAEGVALDGSCVTCRIVVLEPGKPCLDGQVWAQEGRSAEAIQGFFDRMMEYKVGAVGYWVAARLTWCPVTEVASEDGGGVPRHVSCCAVLAGLPGAGAAAAAAAAAAKCVAACTLRLLHAVRMLWWRLWRAGMSRPAAAPVSGCALSGAPVAPPSTSQPVATTWQGLAKWHSW